MDDYYKILGVTKNATSETIRQAYINLVKKYHPDVCHEPFAEELLKKINQAYDVLSDSQKKRSYDNYLNQQTGNLYPQTTQSDETFTHRDIPREPERAWWKNPIIVIGVIIGVLIIAAFLSGIFSNSAPSSNKEINNPISGDPISMINGAELTEPQRTDIVNSTIPVANTIFGSDSPIMLRGKVILFRWTPGTYDSYDYNIWVPEDLVATNRDKEITVLLMTDQEYEFVGTWVNETGQKIPGYKQTTKIIGIYWPENKPAGIAHVIGSAPKEEEMVHVLESGRPLYDWVWDKERKIGFQAIVGDEGITQWISQLPIQSNPPIMGPGIKNPPDSQLHDTQKGTSPDIETSVSSNPRLATGNVILKTDDLYWAGDGLIKVDNTLGSSDAVVILFSRWTDAPIYSVYIRKGSTYEIKGIRAPIYFYFTTGDNWDQKKNKFLINPNYLRYKETFVFEYGKKQIYSLTLYGTPTENTRMEYVDENKFPPL